MEGVIERTRLRVRYPETDSMGVVHHTHYLTWFEVGRTELMRGAGRTYAELEKAGIYMPVVEAACRYRAPARYDEEIEIETRVVAVTKIRVEFAYRVLRRDDGELLATGKTVHVATDANGSPRRFAGEILLPLKALAGSDGEAP